MTQQRPQWRTSSYSGNSGNCVEVAIRAGHAIAVRDSKNPGGKELAFSPQLWQAFVSRTKGGGPPRSDGTRRAFSSAYFAGVVAR